jgi:iron complex outermembrane receptor protein
MTSTRERFARALLASSALMTMGWAGAAHAQDATPVAEEAETVVVTARRREESLQDVPVAVSAFSAAKLDATGAPDITVLQQVSPNTTLQVARGSNSTLIAFIRGVGQQDPLWGFEPGVGLYVDDIYVARPQGAVLDIFDIERIEVLRGPQGTLYGRNTIGGAVKYVTKRLAAAATGKARLAVGSYGQLDFVASGSTPVTDTLRIGGAFASYDRLGYGRNVTTGEEHYDKDVTALRLSAEWEPSEQFFVRVAYDKVTDDSNPKHGHREQPGGTFATGGLAAGTVVLPNVYDTDAGIKGPQKVENQGASLTAEWTVSEAVTVKSVTAWREGSSDTVIDFDTNQVPALDVPARYADEQFSQEFQVLLTGDKLNGVAGLYHMNAVASGAFDTIVGVASLTIATAGKVGTSSTAAYADFSYDFTEQLSVSLGGRFTRDIRSGQVYRQNFTGLRSPLFGNSAAIPGLLRSNYRNERTFEEFTPRASVSYEFSDDLTAYAAYSKGYKSGGFDMRGDVVLTPNTVNGYDPEFVTSYEIGLKGALLDGRINFAGAIFRAEYEGQQITRQEPTVAAGIASFVDNAGSSEIQGFELEGGVRFTDALSATFGIGYTDAQFNEFRSFNAARQPIDLSNIAVFQNTPEWNGNVALNYVRDLGAKGVVTANLTASHRSEYTMFELPNPLVDQLDPYTLLDAGVAWTTEEGRIKISLTGRNLTDERYKVGGYSFPGATFGNVQNSFYGPPRTITGSVQFSF